MFRILLGNDGSSFALRAAEYAVMLSARIGDAEVTSLYVKELSLPIVGFPEEGAGMLPTSSQMEEELEGVCRASQEAVRELFLRAGKDVVLRNEWGRPADAICRMAEGEGFDLIIVGSSGMGQIAEILLGSVSHRVAHRAKVPVLIVRG